MSPTAHELLHDRYISGPAQLAPFARILDWSALSMLNRTTIAANIDRARLLRRLIDESLATGVTDEATFHMRVELHNMLTDLFEVITDDLLLLSAFELHAKAELLRRGYIVHELEAGDLSDQQKKRPLHVRTVRAALNRGEQVRFRDHTIGVSVLLRGSYRAKYPFSPSVLRGLREVQNRRNLIHFHVGLAWTVSEDLLAAAQFLDKAIPQHRKRRFG